jgi:acyl-CoA thioester hydrolase
MPAKEFVLTIVARWADIDLNQHMRSSAYSDWANHSRVEWLNTNGFNLQKFTELKFAPILFEERTKYLHEILLGDRITVDLQLAGMNHDASRWLIRHTFRREDTVCAVYEAKGAWFSTGTRKIAAPPPNLLEACANMVRTDDYAELGSKES